MANCGPHDWRDTQANTEHGGLQKQSLGSGSHGKNQHQGEEPKVMTGWRIRVENSES